MHALGWCVVWLCSRRVVGLGCMSHGIRDTSNRRAAAAFDEPVARYRFGSVRRERCAAPTSYDGPRVAHPRHTTLCSSLCMLRVTNVYNRELLCGGNS